MVKFHETLSERTVRFDLWSPPHLSKLIVNAGTGDDVGTVTNAGVPVILNGGDGEDTLTGGTETNP